ncbi:MAG: MFS transporter [Acidiphilium sp.]
MLDQNHSGSVVLRSVADVRRFIDNRPGSRGSILIVMIALGGVFVDAYDFTSLGIGVVQLKSEFHLSPLALGSVTAMMAFGAFLGALWGGYFTDRVGRLRMFLLDLLFLVVAAIGAALSVNLVMLLAFRFLMGVGVGLDFPVALSFIAEFVAEKRKGGNVNLWQVMWYVAASCTGLVVLPFYLAGAGADLWRIAVGFGAVPALVILLLRIRYMSESALWAAQNVGLDEAARILGKTYGVSVTVAPEVRATASVAAKPRLDFREIFAPTYRMRTLLVSIICATQSMEYFAVGFNLPAISTRLFGTDFIYAILGAILFNLFGIVGAGIGVGVTRRLGVRRIATIGYVLVIASLLLLYAGGPHLPLSATALLIGLFIFGHAFGPGAQGMTMATLSFPTRIRGIGTGWGQGMVRVGSIVGFYFFPVLVAAIGFRSMMLALVLVPLLGLLAAILVPWEPVGHDPDATEAGLPGTGD